jgi:hypothetical protein
LTNRAAIAAGILGAWGLGIVAFAHREMSRSQLERLAVSALKVSPGVDWFTVEHEGNQVGFASFNIDTVPGELQVTELILADTGIAATRRLDHTVIRLSRSLVLRGFQKTRLEGSDSTRHGAYVSDDTLLRSSRHRGGDTTSSAASFAQPLFLREVVPMVSALMAKPQVGREMSLPVFDPEAGTIRDAAVRLSAESLFVVTDSAVADTMGRWYAVHRDTVRAWRVSIEDDSTFEVWVDRLGHPVAMRRAGFSLQRTAYELAFERWRSTRPGRAVPGQVESRLRGSRDAGARKPMIVR